MVAIVRSLASLVSEVSSAKVSLVSASWSSHMHQVTLVIRKSGRGRPLAEHLQLGSLAPSSVSIHAFHPSQVHQPLQGGTQAGRRRQSTTLQWQVLPSALVKHEGAPVPEGHLQYPAPGGGFGVSLVLGVSLPCSFPLAAPWCRLFGLGRFFQASPPRLFRCNQLCPRPLPLRLGVFF